MPSPRITRQHRNPTTPAVTAEKAGRQVMEISECTSECCSTYWNAWVLVFREKNQRQRSKEKKKKQACGFYCEIDLFCSILAGGTSILAPSWGKSEREKSQPSDITTSSPICPIPSVFHFEWDASSPGPLVGLKGPSCLLKAGQTNCIMTNGGPSAVRARRFETSNPVTTNFASTPKQAEQHDDDQAFVCFHARTVSEVWPHLKANCFLHFCAGQRTFLYFFFRIIVFREDEKSALFVLTFLH